MNNVKIIIDWEALLVVLLTLLFVCAKLLGVIEWSWLWVFSPVWILLAISIGIVAIYLLVNLVVIVAQVFLERLK